VLVSFQLAEGDPPMITPIPHLSTTSTAWGARRDPSPTPCRRSAPTAG